MSKLSKREKKKKQEDETKSRFGEDISKRAKGVSKKEWIKAREQEEKSGILPKQIRAREAARRIQLSQKEKEEADKFVDNFQQNAMQGGMSMNPQTQQNQSTMRSLDPMSRIQNREMSDIEKNQADAYAQKVQTIHDSIAELPPTATLDQATEHLKSKGYEVSPGNEEDLVLHMTFEPDTFNQYQQELRRGTQMQSARMQATQAQQEAIQAESEKGWDNAISNVYKSTLQPIGQSMKQVGSAALDTFQRAPAGLGGPFSAYENIRNIKAGIDAINNPQTGEDWKTAFNRGFYNDKARETHWEKTTGKKLIEDNGKINWENARQFVGQAMEAPTYLYAGGAAFSKKLAGGFLSRTGQRAVANLPFAAVNTAIQAVEKGKSITDTIRELPKDFVTNEAMLTAFSTVFGELGRYKAQHKKLPKIEDVKPEANAGIEVPAFKRTAPKNGLPKEKITESPLHTKARGKSLDEFLKAQMGNKTEVLITPEKDVYGTYLKDRGIRVGNKNDSSTILHEIVHKNYGNLSKEEQGAIDYSFNQFNEKYPGAFSTTGKAEEDLARAIEDYPILRKKFGGDFNQKISEGDNGNILVKFFKQNMDEINNVSRITPKEKADRISELTSIWKEANKKPVKNTIGQQLDDYIAGNHPEANPEAFSLANRPGRQGQVSPARTSPKETAPRQSSKTPQPGNNGNFDYTNNAYNPNIEQPAKNVKSRGFLQTVARSKETTPELAKNVRGKQGYTPKTNAEIEKNAIDFVKTEPKQAENFVYNSTDPNEAADITATGIQLIKRYQGEGDHETAGRIAESVAEKLTGWGQGIQAAKLYENLSPEGVMIRVKKAIKQANAEKWFWQKDYSLTDETAKKMFDLANARQGAVDPTLKAELSSQLGEMLGQFHRASLGQQVSLAQTEAQLLNPKTHIRNIVGNEIMYRVERLNKYVSIPIDWTRSKLTGGDRTITFKTARQGEYWKNFLTGAAEAWHGNRLEATQFDIPKQTFKSKWNPLYWGEKVLGASLQGFDHAAFSRAKNQTIGELAYLRGMNEGLKGKALKNAAVKYAKDTDKNILKIAEDYGKYVTFQDDNLLSRGLFIQIKRGLNFGKDFGVGDLVLKYPKTPGAITMRGIEYSPAGFLKSAYEVAYPILRGKAPNTREATLALGRAITGTLGLSGLGYYLADKGIITGRPSKDKDVRATEKQQGLGSYQINLSALKRWVLSGFNDKEANLREGDIHYSYDWAQPLAMSISMGANLNENLKEKQRVGALGVAATGLESAMSGAQTLAEQPLVSGLTRLFGYGDVVGGITNTIQGLPSSFTPSFLNQVNQWADNKSRETYDPDYLKETENLVKARLPFLAQTLPEKINTEGEPTQRYQNNNWFNIFFNPGFVTKFESTPESKLVLDLYNTTGETKQFPKVVSKTVQDENGNTIQLEPQQVEDLQKYVGQRTKDAFTKLAGSKEFTGMSEVDQVDVLSKLLTAIGADAKKEVLGIGQGSGKSDEAVMKYMDMKGLSDTDFNKEVEKLKDQGGNDTIVTALKIYRTNDNARSLGLDTKDDWSQMSISDRNRYLQDKFKGQTDQQKADFMKKMIDKGIAVDPQKYLSPVEYRDFYNSLPEDKLTQLKQLQSTEKQQEREAQGLPSEAQQIENDYDGEMEGMDLKDRYRKIAEISQTDIATAIEYRKLFAQDVYNQYKGANLNDLPAWLKTIMNTDSKFKTQLMSLSKKGKNTNTENDLSNKGVQNEERANAIWDELQTMPEEEWQDYLQNLKAKKILTKTVMDQIRKLKK